VLKLAVKTKGRRESALVSYRCGLHTAGRRLSAV
jgi:hypothetical protein